MRRVISSLVVVLALGSPVALAEGIDSEHLFGLTEGTDIGAKGERELELELEGRFGKRSGTYRVISQASALKLTLTDSFRVAPAVAVDHHSIRGVPGLDDRNNLSLAGFAFEMKYRALDRQAAPFGLTVGVTPFWGRTDETSGERANAYGVNALVMADRELIANRLFAAFNIGIATGASQSRVTRDWEHDSVFSASAALSGRISERVFLGGEVRYERAHDGMAFDRFAGHGLFIGPSLYARITEAIWISLVWSAQVAGHAAGDGRAFDLTNFERHLVKGRIGIAF